MKSSSGAKKAQIAKWRFSGYEGAQQIPGVALPKYWLFFSPTNEVLLIPAGETAIHEKVPGACFSKEDAWYLLTHHFATFLSVEECNLIEAQIACCSLPKLTGPVLVQPLEDFNRPMWDVYRVSTETSTKLALYLRGKPLRLAPKEPVEMADTIVACHVLPLRFRKGGIIKHADAHRLRGEVASKEFLGNRLTLGTKLLRPFSPVLFEFVALDSKPS